jgi:uncharacterized protein (TIGR00369 family)
VRVIVSTGQNLSARLLAATKFLVPVLPGGYVPASASACGARPSHRACAPIQGKLYGGAIAMLAGTAIDGAVQTTLPAGTAFGPVDLKVCFLPPVSPDGRDLVARGTVIHRGRSVAIGTSEVFDANGRKVAVATGSSVILPGRPATVTGTPYHVQALAPPPVR